MVWWRKNHLNWNFAEIHWKLWVMQPEPSEKVLKLKRKILRIKVVWLWWRWECTINIQLKFPAELILFIKGNPLELADGSQNPMLIVHCQAQLLLISAQISKFHSQSLNSETKGAELTLKSQCTTTHPPPPITFQSSLNGKL